MSSENSYLDVSYHDDIDRGPYVVLALYEPGTRLVRHITIERARFIAKTLAELLDRNGHGVKESKP